MDYETVKKFVEKEGGPYEFTVDSMPERFIEPMVMQGMKVDTIERGRIVCSFTVPPRLVVFPIYSITFSFFFFWSRIDLLVGCVELWEYLARRSHGCAG